MTALLKKTAISPTVSFVSKREDQKEPPAAIGGPCSARTARAITRNHGSYYKTVPEGEFSCSTLYDDDGGEGQRVETRGDMVGGRLDRATGLSLEISSSRGDPECIRHRIRERYYVTTYGDGGDTLSETMAPHVGNATA